MSFEAIAAIAAVILGYAFVSERLAVLSVSGPLVFVGGRPYPGPSASSAATSMREASSYSLRRRWY